MASADWDFERTEWSEDTTHVVSSPKSLKLLRTAGGVKTWSIIRNTAESLAVDQGRIVSWVWADLPSTTYSVWCFRAQGPVGTATFANSYRVDVGPTQFTWWYVDALGVATLIGQCAWTHPVGSWVKVRITWWNGKDGTGTPATVLRCEYFDGAAWIQAGIDLYDTNERNKGSATNRCGVGHYYASDYGVWLDDTEIWRAS